MKKSKAILPVLLACTMLSACANTPATSNDSVSSTTTAESTLPPETSAETTAEETDAPEETPAEETDAPEETSAEETDAPEETAPPKIPHEGELYADFVNGIPETFEASNGWTNGSMFNVTWRADNVTFNDGKMQLIIDKDETPLDDIPYSGGEFRSKEYYGYGRYEVKMKAIKNDGVVSSFFTYTGPYDKDPWDEIDIEILGKDTTKVQFNYFTDSVGEHEYMHDLGFDASEDFHEYAFEWHKDKIVWFVDGVEVYSATENIPVTKGKIMMNAWCGEGVDAWLNPFDDSNMPLTAEYEWIKFTPFDE